MAIWVLTFRHRVAESSFLQNFLYFAKTQYSLPLFIFYLIYKGASHKAARANSAFYKDIRLAFLFGVYSVFAPFNIFCAHQAVFSPFELFCVPLLYFSMLVIFVSKIHEAFRVHPPVTICLALISLVAPPAIHALWVLNELPILMYTLFALFLSYGVALFILKFLHIKKSEEPSSPFIQKL